MSETPINGMDSMSIELLRELARTPGAVLVAERTRGAQPHAQGEIGGDYVCRVVTDGDLPEWQVKIWDTAYTPVDADGLCRSYRRYWTTEYLQERLSQVRAAVRDDWNTWDRQTEDAARAAYISYNSWYQGHDAMAAELAGNPSSWQKYSI